MRRKLTILFSLLILGTGLLAQTKHIESVNNKGDEIVIPYWKGQLENGLTLIIHEDHSDPIVHVDITYHVGSAREELNKSGFAHFFEHMMFQGSEFVEDEEHFKIVTEAGGTMNGSTSRDRTNYYQTVPSNQLETVLWLEADRMGWLLPAVTQEKFEIQRATVKNEKQQNYDNSPYGMWREYNSWALYPYGHPYSWLTIGIIEDLDRVGVEDLKSFFMRWYGPNNATLTVGGDVNPKEVISLVEKYFGGIPRCPVVSDMELDAPVLDTDRYVSYEDMNIRFPALLMTFPTVPTYHPDEPALDCLSEIIGAGRSSYFYKKFVETQKAIQASVFHPTSELSGEFTMFVLPFPGQTLSDFEEEMRTALQQFEEEGVKDEDIQKFIAGFESSTINGLATVSGKVTQLAAYETYLNNPNFIQEQLRRYTSVTKEDVIRVYNKYIKGKPAVFVSVLPKGAGMDPAKPINYEKPIDGVNPFTVTDYSGLVYKRPDIPYDKSVRPVPGQAPLVSVPDYWLDETSNGIEVIGTRSDEIPTVAIRIAIDGGQKLDAKDPTKAGLASLTAAMLNESTENFTAEEIALELEKLGSSIGIYGSDNSTIISIRSLVKNLDATLDLLEEKMYRPKFIQEDFDRLKKQQLEAIQANQKDPGAIASQVYYKLVYGENHIMSVPSEGVLETVENIQLDDIRSFYENYFSPDLSELVVVGDVSKKEVMKKLEFLDDWKVKDIDVPKMPSAPGISKTKIYLMDKEEAPQSEIRVGYMTDMAYDATEDYFKSYLMNYPLGGAFNSRINLNLREENGWTYGARSYFSSSKDPGPFTVSTGVKANATDSAVFEIMKELTDYQKEGITEEELEFMKKSIGQRDALKYEAPYQKAGFLSRIIHYDLDKNYVNEQNEIINDISQKEINKLAKKNIPVDKMNIIVVGDKATNIEGLQRLGYEIIEVDAKGNIIQDTNLDMEK